VWSWPCRRPHHAGWGILKQDAKEDAEADAEADAGLALRFPRFTGRCRDHKAPDGKVPGDATIVAEVEVVQMLHTARRAPAGT